MPLFESEALVLRTYNLAEADRIVVLLTREFGIIRGVAKGAKRLKSKFGGGLEPFSVVRLEYFQKEQLELASIRHIELLESYFSNTSDPAFLQKFAYLAEILTAFSPPHDPNEKLYRMVLACLKTAAKDASALEGVGLYFEIWLLRLGGYLPDWSKCFDCKRVFSSGESANLQSNFHLICANCQKASGTQPISSPHREIYAAAQKLSPDDFAAKLRDMKPDLQAVSQILKRIIGWALGRDVKERNFENTK